MHAASLEHLFERALARYRDNVPVKSLKCLVSCPATIIHYFSCAECRRYFGVGMSMSL